MNRNAPSWLWFILLSSALTAYSQEADIIEECYCTTYTCDDSCIYTDEAQDDSWCSCGHIFWTPARNLVINQAPFYRAADCGCASIFGTRGFFLENEAYTLQFSGFVKSDNYLDTRQVVGVREDYLSFLPAPERDGINGKDINARGQLRMLAIQTRTQMLVTNSPQCETRTAAFMEIDFIGPWVVDALRDRQIDVNAATGGVLLRHAFIQIDWHNLSFLAGQFWHPLVPPEAEVRNPTAYESSPCEPVGRYPQLRLTGKPFSCLELIGAAISQLDFKNNGPIGFSSKYLRDNVLPNLHGQARFYFNDMVFGASLDFKRLIPRLSTTSDDMLFKTRQGVSAVSAQAYARAYLGPVVATGIVTYASNLTDQLMLGGYAVTAQDPISGEQKYTPVRAIATSCTIYLRCCIEPGLMIGYTKNIGTSKDLYERPNVQGNERFIIFGRAGGETTLPPILNAIDYVLRIAPRIKWHHNALTIAGEVAWLRASYGQLTNRAKVVDGVPVNNVRLGLSFYFSF